MRRSSILNASFSAVRSEGGLLPADILARIAVGDQDLPGISPCDYHLTGGEKLNEVINNSWTKVRAIWGKFRPQYATIGKGDTGTSQTRETLLLPLFAELGYGRLLLAKKEERSVGDKDFGISHFWHHSPIHLVGCNIDLDKKMSGVRGAAQASPHSTVQEFLNRSDAHLWGFCSNGLRLRILRNNVSFSRQAYIEFDLESLFEGEVFSDFVLLWLLCHQSRVESDDPASCRLEQWTKSAQERSVRALESLRDSVQRAIEILGQGFLEGSNATLKDRLRSGVLLRQDYFRQLLRLVYRLLFLFAAEDRNLLHARSVAPSIRNRYTAWYSSTHLRRLAGKIVGTKHSDFYEGLKLVMGRLGSENGCPELGLSPFGSFLWSDAALPDISKAVLSNSHLLNAVRKLAYTETEGLRRLVDYKNIGARELGSIYESLLELNPRLDSRSGAFTLEAVSGNERKTTGSYYTPAQLIDSLLDSALEPIIRHAMRQENPESALLDLKICDPACGSGHFLIAAAHRLAKRLAAVRTEDEEPGPDAVCAALRDVIGRCIYGVDSNPMSVELCKVGLWLEALEPGKPLSFLDHHIRCGNSLMGTTPKLIAAGLPDEAFKAIEGDENKACAALRKKNKVRMINSFQLPLMAEQEREDWDNLRRVAGELENLPSDSVKEIEAKEAAFRHYEDLPEYQNKRRLADAWCAAFVMRKYFPEKPNKPGLKEDEPFGLTVWHLKDLATGTLLKPELAAEVENLARQYGFFHWHLAWPEVFARGGAKDGFDVMLGNPPWEHTELKEKEWFAERRPDIANAQTGADRKRMIEDIKTTDLEMYLAFHADLRRAEGESHFMRNSGRYPFCGRGRINLYAIFAEAARAQVNDAGRIGLVVPSGIATDDTTKFFFQDLMKTKSLVSLYDFENKGIFPDVHNSYKFCLLTSGNGARPLAEETDFAFFLHGADELRNPKRRVSLSAKDIALLNPNTRTCPIFRSGDDAELTKAIYRRVPVLIREAQNGRQEENPWGIKFKQGLFNMTSDSKLFRTREQLEADGWELNGNVFENGNERYLPLYEAKMATLLDHRSAHVIRSATATVRQAQPEYLTEEEHQKPDIYAKPLYWVSEKDVKERTPNFWKNKWISGWRGVSATTNERTFLQTIFPQAGIGHSIFLMYFDTHTLAIENNLTLHCIFPCLASFIFDFAVRQKMGGTNLNFFLVAQLPVLSSHQLTPKLDFILPRILELTYTAHDLAPFARDCLFNGPPFRWDEERRFLLRCELDAAFFHLYLPSNPDGTWKKADNETEAEFSGLTAAFPTPRQAVDYIMETFPIVKRRDEATLGDYRTKRVILEIYDQLQEAATNGTAYRTRLDPPPGDAGCRHA